MSTPLVPNGVFPLFRDMQHLGFRDFVNKGNINP